MLKNFEGNITGEAYRRLCELVGEGNYILADSEGKIDSYVHDETFLQGKASLVLLPSHHEQVRDILLALNVWHEQVNADEKENLVLTSRGLGSGLSGGAVPESGIVLATERMNQIFEINTEDFYVHAQAGVITQDLQERVRSQGLFYPPDPSSAGVSCIGGNVATNAAGPHSLKYGRTRDYVAKLRVVWGDGREDWLGTLPRKTSVGLDLKHLVIGSEGQLGVVTEVVLHLRAPAELEQMLAVGFSSYEEAADCVVNIRRKGLDIAAMEFLDEPALASVLEQWPQALRDSKALLLIEVDGSEESVFSQLEKLQELLPQESVYVARDEASRSRIWAARKGVTEALKQKAVHKIGEDIAVPLSQMPKMIEEAHRLGSEYQVETVVWGHAADGNLHVNMLFNNAQEHERVHQMMKALAQKTVELNGSVSGEHGLGRLKRPFIYLEQSTDLVERQRAIKEVFDPSAVLSPQLTVHSYNQRSDLDIFVPPVSSDENLHTNVQ